MPFVARPLPGDRVYRSDRLTSGGYIQEET